MSKNEIFERGLEVRRAVLGDNYVDTSLGQKGEAAQDMQEIVTVLGWGYVWSRQVLERRARSLMTLSLLIALDRPRELRLHTQGALNNGCTADEAREAVLHSIPYCGIPAALDAMAVVDEVFDELEVEKAQG